MSANVCFNNCKTNHSRIYSTHLCFFLFFGVFLLPFIPRQPENIITLVLVFLWGLCVKSGIDYQALNAQQYISVWLNQHKSAQAYAYRLGDYFPFTARQSKQQEAEPSPAVLLPAEQALCRYWSMSRLRDGMPKPTKINSPRTGHFFRCCSPEIRFDFLMPQTSENCLTCHFLSQNKKSFMSLIGYIFPKASAYLTIWQIAGFWRFPCFPLGLHRACAVDISHFSSKLFTTFAL